MGSINHDLQSISAAEKARGCVFNERFRSAAEIAKNAGTIILTVCSYPAINKVKTVIAKLSEVQAGSMTVKINSSQTITIAAGSLFGSYDNATAFNADDIQVDDYSKFEYLMIFRNQLSTEEKTAYQEGTMWTYMKNAVLVMDGRLINYDPTNTRVLDASGNGNHLTLGDGSTASTYPTNLTKIGYRSDGSDDYLQLPDRAGKYAYALYKLSTGQTTFGAITTVYDDIKTSGSFSGNLKYLALFSSALNQTQIIDLKLSINPNSKE